MASSEAGRGDILSVYALIDRLYFVYLDFFQIIRGEGGDSKEVGFWKISFREWNINKFEFGTGNGLGFSSARL